MVKTVSYSQMQLIGVELKKKAKKPLQMTKAFFVVGGQK